MFRHFDPLRSVFSSSTPDLVDSAGSPLLSTSGAKPALLALANGVAAVLNPGGAPMAPGLWAELLSTFDEGMDFCRWFLNAMQQEGKVSARAPDGSLLGDFDWSYEDDHVVLSAVKNACETTIKANGSTREAENLRQSTAILFCIACLSEIDAAIASVAGPRPSADLAVQHGIRAGTAYLSATQTSSATAPIDLDQHIQDMRKLQAQNAGQASAESRKATALDGELVVRLARNRGWPDRKVLKLGEDIADELLKNHSRKVGSERVMQILRDQETVDVASSFGWPGLTDVADLVASKTGRMTHVVEKVLAAALPSK